ncbi:CLUMA_CG001123, isoform A [Clunio marinus]|uniref:CLUMA_CG001123, isoform A n=1 Tax=Clunio marinus TaxID=568069 RepID=A0A1J1HM71_9DIPT|nr:CLUMA_CG001123, isoform A [Clunio marinus]
MISNWIKKEAQAIENLGIQMQYKFKGSPKVVKFAQLLSLQLEHRSTQISYGVFVMDWKFFFATLCVVFSDILVLFG